MSTLTSPRPRFGRRLCLGDLTQCIGEYNFFLLHNEESITETQSSRNTSPSAESAFATTDSKKT